MKLSVLLFNVMQETKAWMRMEYSSKNWDGIREQYHHFRVFCRYLFIRGNIVYNHEQLFDYVKREMVLYVNTLLRDEAKEQL